MTHSVLAIDPGSRKMGFAVIDCDGQGLYRSRDHGTQRYSAKLEFSARLLRIHQDVYEFIDAYRPDALAIEKAFVGESVSSSMKLGEARAAAIIAAGRMALPVFEITPAEAKKRVTGNGRAAKEQVRHVVASILSLEEQDLAFDASDALSIGLAYLFEREIHGPTQVFWKPKKKPRRRSRWSMDEVAQRGIEIVE